MPTAPMHRCPTCPALLRRRQPCHTCRKATHQRQDAQRGSSHQRGYGSDWRRWRARTVFEHSLVYCGDRPTGAPETSDSICQASGGRTLGDDLDHIVPITGKQDPRRFDETNVQLLCDRPPNYCHSRKRKRESIQSRAGAESKK